MSEQPGSQEAAAVVEDFAQRLLRLGWVDGLMVAGSLATGDWHAGVSDLDLVALVDGPLDASRRASVRAVHRTLDRGAAAGMDLGCCYVDVTRIGDLDAQHPTWTHGYLVERILSGAVRAELVRCGYPVFGPAPLDVLPAMSDDDVRETARAEVTGYWGWAARRPHMWLSPVIAELGLTSMARGRHTLATGELLTKTAALDEVRAPTWLVEQLRARRRGEAVTSPRLPTAAIAWIDACRTVRAARRTDSPADRAVSFVRSAWGNARA